MTPALWVLLLAVLEALLKPQLGLSNSAFSLLYSWTPAAVAYVFSRREGVRFPVLGTPNRYWGLALILPPALAGIATLLSLPVGTWRGLAPLKEALPNLANLPDIAFFFLLFFYGLLLSATVGVIFALGGEIFWRGYLWERFRERGLWPASLEIGFYFGLWSLPSLFATASLQENLFLKLFFPFAIGILITPGLLWMREKGEAVFAAALFLAGVHAWSFLPRTLVEGPEALVGFYSLPGLATLALFNLALRRWTE